MRINSKQDIAGLGKHAQKQILKALEANNRPQTSSPKASTPSSSKAKPTSINKKKNKPSRIMTDEQSGLKFCPYPSTDPGAWLHTALNKKYGSYDNGGDHAHEVIIPGHDVRFRWDHIIYGMVCIELDGYGYHFDLKSFKRDREKQKHALVNGFIVHRVTSKDIKTNLQGVLADIDLMLAHHQRYKMKISPVGKTQYTFDGRELID